MSIDIVGEMIGLKNAYGRMRGAGPVTGKQRPNGGNWMTPGKQVPQTTWADVFIAASHINKYLDPSQKQCVAILQKQNGMRVDKALVTCIMGDRNVNPTNFPKTSGYKAARANFNSVSPLAKAGFLQTMNPFKMKEIYPHNEEFWGGALTYAIERSAAGAVPYRDEIAIESIKEAVVELPATIGSALDAITPEIPDFSGFADLIKWGSIGGGLFALYWYVLKPSGKKKKTA